MSKIKITNIICLLMIFYIPFCAADNNYNFIYEKYNLNKDLKLFSIEKESDLFWGEYFLIRILRTNSLPLSFDFFIYNSETEKVMPFYSESSLLFKPISFNRYDYNNFVIPLKLQLKNKNEYLNYLERIERIFRNTLIINRESVISYYKNAYYLFSAVNDNLHSFYEEQINRIGKINYYILFEQIKLDRAKIRYYSFYNQQIHVLSKVTIIIKSNGEIVEINRERDYESKLFPDKADVFNFFLK